MVEVVSIKRSKVSCCNNKKSACLHIECELHFRVVVGVVDLEKAVDELFQIDVSTSVQVEHCEEALSNDSWELGVL